MGRIGRWLLGRAFEQEVNLLSSRFDLLESHIAVQAFDIATALKELRQSRMADLHQIHEHLDNMLALLDSRIRECANLNLKAVQMHLDNLSETLGARAKETSVQALHEIHEHLDNLSETLDARAKDASDRVLHEVHEHLDNLATSLTAGGKDASDRVLHEFHEHLNNAEASTRGFAEDILRSDIRTRWQVIDALDSILYPPTMEVACLLCGHVAPRKSYETRVSQCIFGGGRLERYVCPSCGCVFGPLKMTVLDEKSLAAEYAQHYRVYCEGDSKWKEKLAFEALKPVKEGKYLNFGAGVWSKTTVDLRNEGWNVWDYEPYAPADERTWVIRSMAELRGHKFDGIFSNDVLEHFKDPVSALKDMAEVLAPNGQMAHCTGCYEYAYEYTRFHYVFFTGKSVEMLASAVGMNARLGERLKPDEPARICMFRK